MVPLLGISLYNNDNGRGEMLFFPFRFVLFVLCGRGMEYIYPNADFPTCVTG